MVVRHMTFFMYFKCNMPQFSTIVSALLVATIYTIHLRIVVTYKTSRRHYIELCFSNQIIPKVMDMGRK